MTSYRTRKLIRKAQLGLEEDIMKYPRPCGPCTTCYACVERCPVGVGDR